MKNHCIIYTKAISIALVFYVHSFAVFGQEKDSLMWKQHFMVNMNLFASNLNNQDDIFKNKDKFNHYGSLFSVNYGYNIKSIGLGLHSGVELQLTNGNSLRRNSDTKNLRIEESFLRLPLYISHTFRLNCGKPSCLRTNFFQLKGGFILSLSMNQRIGDKDVFESTNINENWGYMKTGAVADFSFIITNGKNEKQRNHVFGVRLESDLYDSRIKIKSDFIEKRFVTPYYNSISLYYVIKNVFWWY